MNIGTLWAQIGLDNSLLKSGAKDSDRVINDLAGSINSKLAGAASVARSALGLLGVAFSADYIIRQVNAGIEAIDNLHLSTVKMASMIATMQGPDNIAQKYAEAKKYAVGLADELRKIDDISFANAEGLQAMAETMIMQGQVIDTNNKKEMESFAALSNMVAMYTQGQNQGVQIRQEMRALMTGEARMGAVIAQQIDQMAKSSGDYKNGLKDIIKLGKEHGDFWARIEPYLAGVKAAAPDIANSWESVKSSWDTAMTQLKRNVFADVYKEAIEKGREFVDYIKNNSEQIANAIKTSMSILGAAAKIALAYFMVFKVGGGILTAARAILVWFDTRLLLATFNMQNSGIVARLWAAIFGSEVVTATWKAGNAMTRLSIIGSTIMAFFAGWQIGKVLAEKFETVRLFGVALAAGLHKIFARIVTEYNTLKMLLGGGASFFKSVFLADYKGMVTGLKTTWDNVKGVRAAGKEKVKQLDDFYAQSFFEQTDEQMAGPRKSKVKVKVPDMEGFGDKGGGAGKGGAGSAKSDADARLTYIQAAQEKELTILRNANAVRMALLNTQKEQGLVSTKAYLDQKYALETAGTQKELEQVKARMVEREAIAKKLSGKKGATAGSYQERAKVEQDLAKINELESQLMQKKIEYDNEMRKSNEELAKSYTDVTAQILEYKGKYEEAAKLKVEQDRKSAERMSVVSAASDGDAKAQALQAELEMLDKIAIAKARQQDLDEAMTNKLSAYEIELQKISALETTYSITNADAAQKRQDIYAQELAILETRRQAQETSSSEGMRTYLALTSQIQQTNNSLQEQIKIVRELRGTFGQGFSDAVKIQQEKILSLYQLGTKTLNDYMSAAENALSNAFGALLQGKIDSLMDVFTQFGQAVLKIIADIMAQMTMASLMGKDSWSGGGGSGWGSVISGIIGGISSYYSGGAGGVNVDTWGGIAGGLMSGWKKGGTFDSPSLSAHSNSVVTKPTFFAFASGAGVMGEAGPEAILPLSRNSKGELGVKTDRGNTKNKNNVTHVHHWNVHALDAQSFHAYLMQNRESVASAMGSLISDNSPARRMG